MTAPVFECMECRKTFSVWTWGMSGATPEGSSRYGTDTEGNKVCAECCGIQDRRAMLASGQATLYLTINECIPAKHYGFQDVSAHLTNWPGNLRFPVYRVKKGRRNMARVRYDVWFTGPDGHDWHGTQFGDNTQICRCRKGKC